MMAGHEANAGSSDKSMDWPLTRWVEKMLKIHCFRFLMEIQRHVHISIRSRSFHFLPVPNFCSNGGTRM